MTDQELLEKAARAAGFELIYQDGIAHAAHRDFTTTPCEKWNPLEDDADAFRLMVDILINVEMSFNVVTATSPEGHEILEETGEWGPMVDHHAMMSATRRAIVRAAAAMGDEE